MIDAWGISCELALRWMSFDLTDDKSTLVQVMAWCHQATSHYLSQCWPRSMSPNGVIRPQWVNDDHSTYYLQVLDMMLSFFLVKQAPWNDGPMRGPILHKIIYGKVHYTGQQHKFFSYLIRSNNIQTIVSCPRLNSCNFCICTIWFQTDVQLEWLIPRFLSAMLGQASW